MTSQGKTYETYERNGTTYVDVLYRPILFTEIGRHRVLSRTPATPEEFWLPEKIPSQGTPLAPISNSSQGKTT